jgi:hypothetical protein
MLMKMRLQLSLAALAAALAWTASTHAAILVNDTWQDGTRTDPASPTYAENNGLIGTDADADGDIESVWYSSPSASLTASAGSPGGQLLMDNTAGGTTTTGSSSYTTYFTAEATPVTLSQGEKLRVTWKFTPTTLGTDTGRGMRSAIANSPVANRLAGNGSPSNGLYSGYRVSFSMSTANLPANALELRERLDPLTSAAFLSADSAWTGSIASVGGGGATKGMVNGVEYTYLLELMRTASDELQIDASLSGGTGNDALNGSGTLALSFLDTTPNGSSFTFDTFGLRPSSSTVTAAGISSSLFRVEVVPEPASAMLASLGGLAMFAFRRRR